MAGSLMNVETMVLSIYEINNKNGNLDITTGIAKAPGCIRETYIQTFFI